MNHKKLTITLVCLVGIMSLINVGCANSTQVGSNKNTSTAQSTKEPVSNEKANDKLYEMAIKTGSDDSKVTIIEASDVECPACRSIHPEFKKVVEEYKDKVRFGYVPYPLSYHEDAMPGALAIEAANLQGKGWEMHEALFDADSYDASIIEEKAKEIGLDMDKFNSDKDSQELKDKIDEAMQFLNDLELQGTPTFYINGVEYQGTPYYANLSAEIEERLGE